MSPHVLIIDDQEAIRQFLAATLALHGYRVSSSGTASEGLAIAAADPPALVLLDLRLPDMSGLDVLKELKARNRSICVVILTSYGRGDVAVQAMKLDAFDFVTKPVDLDRLLAVIRRGLGGEPDAAAARLGRDAELFETLPDVVPAMSAPMRGIYEQVRKIAAGGRSTVMILGESGVGKDVLAQIIHANSPRRDYPFLDLNCASLPEQLLESELFGHERGAFTDATEKKMGLLELAHSGTLFLDEIGDMPPAVQVKLLRVLEKMVFRRVGGLENIEVDVRIVAATNRDLDTLIRQGRFREDLAYRLRVIQIEIPPLRERPDDVHDLTMRFLIQYTKEFDKRFSGLADDALDALKAQRWPGNIRQLRNTIERSILLEDGAKLTAAQLHFDPEPSGTSGTGDPVLAMLETALYGEFPPDGMDLDALLQRVEQAMISKALETTGGNQSRAARLLGLGRDRLRYRIKQHERSA